MGNIITRSNAEALIPTETSKGIIQKVTETSAVLPLMRRLPNMSTKTRKMAVLSAMPVAGFVDGDNGLKPVSSAAWKDKFITAEEIAVIIPIPEAVLDDAEYDIWAELEPSIIAAFNNVVDTNILFESDRTEWPTPIVPSAIARNHAVALGTSIDIAEDTNVMMATVEDDGFDVDGFAGATSVKSKFRGLRDKNGGLLFQPSLTAGTPDTLYGQSLSYVKNGAWDKSKALMVGGEWQQAVYSIRQDLTFKVLDQAVISDADGKIIYNLAQQDMVALRCVMRLGWQLPNPITNLNENEETRYPFAVLTPTGVGA